MNSRKRVALLVVLLGQFMLVLDATVVNVALPEIKADLHLTNASLTWVTNAYLIAFGGLLLLFGRLGDLLGRRQIFLLGLGVFTFGSLLCGIAASAEALIGARFVQGIGAAGVGAVALAMIAVEFPAPAERARAMSGYVFVAVSGGACGLLVGGALTEALSWHWIFLINLPIGVLAIAVGRAVLRATPGLGAGRVDVAGAVLVTAAAMSGIYAIVSAAHHGWTDPVVFGFGGGALALVAGFLWHEARTPNPLLPLRILRLRTLMVTSVIRACFVTGLYGIFFFGTLEMTHDLGLGPLHVGLAFLPMSAMVATMSSGIAARLIGRYGPRTVLLGGLTMIGLALTSFAVLPADAPYWPWRCFSFALLGLGGGSTFLPLLTLAMSEVPANDAGLGSAIVNLSQQLAAAASLALLATIASHHTDALIAGGEAPGVALTGGFHFAYAVAVGAIIAGIAITALLIRQPQPKPV